MPPNWGLGYIGLNRNWVILGHLGTELRYDNYLGTGLY
jgi:hypothetical protein